MEYRATPHGLRSDHSALWLGKICLEGMVFVWCISQGQNTKKKGQSNMVKVPKVVTTYCRLHITTCDSCVARIYTADRLCKLRLPNQWRKLASFYNQFVFLALHTISKNHFCQQNVLSINRLVRLTRSLLSCVVLSRRGVHLCCL